MEFKFKMGAMVRRRPDIKKPWKVVARIETTHGPCYRISTVSGKTFEVKEKSLWLAHYVPRWLHVGAEIQWLGTSFHLSTYTVKEMHRGSKYKPGSFSAERNLVRSDGSSCGTEKFSSSCVFEDMKFWRLAPKNAERLKV